MVKCLNAFTNNCDTVVVYHHAVCNTKKGVKYDKPISAVKNNINPSGVYVVPQPNSYTLIPRNPANSPNNSDENSDGDLLNIAGKSIFDHNKTH